MIGSTDVMINALNRLVLKLTVFISLPCLSHERICLGFFFKVFLTKNSFRLYYHFIIEPETFSIWIMWFVFDYFVRALPLMEFGRFYWLWGFAFWVWGLAFYSLTAPAVIPLMMYFCMKMKISTTGIIATIANADR